MTFKTNIGKSRRQAAAGSVLAASLGWAFLEMPVTQFLANWSYDLPILLTPADAPANVVLVEMDGASRELLNQKVGDPFDRRLHGQLLDYLRADGSHLVVFIIRFLAPRDLEADRALANAIHAHGRVVLAAGLEEATPDNRLSGSRVIPPADVFLEVGTDAGGGMLRTNYGPTWTTRESDGIVRRIYPGTGQVPALPWAAAARANPTWIRPEADHFEERWIRYYGPPRTLPRMSYGEATNQVPGFYNGKTVFIGDPPGSGSPPDFPSPWRLHHEPSISGLELKATEYLNLVRGDFLRRLPRAWELGLIGLLGLLSGWGFVRVHWLPGIGLALFGVVALMAQGVALASQNLWFAWCVTAFVQFPAAWAWSAGCQAWQLAKDKELLETPLPGGWDESPAEPTAGPLTSAAPGPASPPAPTAMAIPLIPDHELLRLVGRGAYGEVWLARDILGNFHAVKIIRRDTFDETEPFDREFHGLQKFTPISREHPCLVHILHVGRNLEAGYLYYVMEAGDDEKSGTAIDPPAYSPRNLGRDLRRRAPLPLRECVELGAALCDGLEFLHRQGLIHRDIKPANIIFVNGRPKLADIGLVTEIACDHRKVSKVGTEGYLPPEGPGTAAGDLFALGMVLEDMIRRRPAAGRSAAAADAAPSPDDPGLEPFRAVIRKACAIRPEERFASAGVMKEALLAALPAG